MGKDLLRLYGELINTHFYQNDNELNILKDLENKLKRIKKWEAIDYNKEIANSICKYLEKQTQF